MPLHWHLGEIDWKAQLDRRDGVPAYELSGMLMGGLWIVRLDDSLGLPGNRSYQSLIEIGTGSLPLHSNDHVVTEPGWNTVHLPRAGLDLVTIFNLP